MRCSAGKFRPRLNGSRFYARLREQEQHFAHIIGKLVAFFRFQSLPARLLLPVIAAKDIVIAQGLLASRHTFRQVLPQVCFRIDQTARRSALVWKSRSFSRASAPPAS